MENIKIKSLVEYLEEERDNVVWEYDNVFSSSYGEYLVLNEEEKEEALKEYIKENLWAFNSSFLSSLTNIDKIVFETLSQLCESGNDAIKAIVNATCGLDEIIEEAVRYDGAGHFLADYDGEEIELDNNLYAYRVG